MSKKREGHYEVSDEVFDDIASQKSAAEREFDELAEAEANCKACIAFEAEKARVGGFWNDYSYGFEHGARWQHARDHAALAESGERVRELEQELNKYKIVNKYHAEKLGQLDHLIEKAEAAITTFQWVTNSFKMSPEQQVRLGDAIVGLHDACEAAKDKAIRSGRGGERG